MKDAAEFSSVWDAVADTPEEAATLRTRAELMHAIEAIITAAGWNEIEAAQWCGVTQPE